MTADPQLDTLEAKGLIRLASVDPELEYLFRHWLVQDAAYGSLLRQERRELHRLVGETLEQLYGERHGELAAVLALHFEQAGDGARAREHLMIAAEHALARHAIREARAFYERAEAQLPPPASDEDAALRRLRVVIAVGKIKSGWTFTPLDRELEALAAVVPIAEDLGDLKLLGELYMHDALLRQFSGGAVATNQELQRSLRRIKEIGDQLGDRSMQAIPSALLGIFQVFTGHLHEAVAALEAAAPLLEEKAEFVGAAFARGALAVGYARLGEFEKADKAAAESVELAANADPIAQLDALITQAFVRSAQGRLDETVPLARICVDKAEETGGTACLIVSNYILGDAYLRQGLIEEAQRVLQRSNEITVVTMRDFWRPSVQGSISQAAALLGDFGAAEKGWEEALQGARQSGHRFAEATILHKRAEAEAEHGEAAAAWADFAASAALFEEMDARPFLGRVLRSWGEALARAGEPGADEKLVRARALLEEVGLVDEARAVGAGVALSS